MIAQLSPAELSAWRDDPVREPPLVVDVREPWETGICRIDGSQCVPLAQLPASLGLLPRERDIVLVCHHGVRSLHAGMWLRTRVSSASTTCAAASPRGPKTSSRRCRAIDLPEQNPNRTTAMKLRLLALLVPLALASAASGAEDLLQIYREAQQSDPTLAGARANWSAVQERVPQARVRAPAQRGRCPGSANAAEGRTSVRADPRNVTANGYGNAAFTISASQPLYRQQNVIAFDQARRVVEQADYTLAASQQDLIMRVTVAYFDVLLAEVNVELAEAQKRAVSEQLAQAKRNFEVGIATITDTNEAQARYDSIVAQEIAARNDLDNRRTALRTIIGRMPGELKRARGRVRAHRARAERRSTTGSTARCPTT